MGASKKDELMMELVGKKIGDVLVLAMFRDDHLVKYSCKCKCGKEFTIVRYNLLNNANSMCYACRNKAAKEIQKECLKRRPRVMNISKPYKNDTAYVLNDIARLKREKPDGER